jgi:hypothetical protein
MKLVIASLVITANFFLLSCAKTRTCSCKNNSTRTTVTTPRSGSQPSTTTSSSINEENTTLSKVKKKEMRRVFDCNSKKETSTNTYTTLVTVNTVSTIATFTFNVPVNYTADVASTTTDDYTCEIK